MAFEKPHALVYQGPFEVNYRRLKRGSIGYRRRDGSSVPGYKVPRGTTGLVFGIMEKKGHRSYIVRVQAPRRDLRMAKPITCQGTGPSGTRLTPYGAMKYLRALMRANPRQRAALKSLLPYVQEPAA